ncbi:homocitrate synthase [Lachnospiraceae bacterium ZAX-1]
MKVRKYIIDTTLRDGEQSPDISFSRCQKIEIAKILSNAGIGLIEVGVPSSGSYEKDTICRIIERKGATKISVWSRLNVDDVRHCIDCEPDIVHISIPVSYVHIYSKLRKNKTWVMNQLYACIGLLDASKSEISIGFEDTFRSDITFMFTLTQVLSDFGITRLRLADTVGVTTPGACSEMFRQLGLRLGVGAKLGFHAHNDLGMAVANTLSALKSGCDYADTTMFGIGERAGNCDFFKLIRATSNLFDWGISTTDAELVQKNFNTILNRKDWGK